MDIIRQDDSKHRARWRELYTQEECEQLKELVDAAEKQVRERKCYKKERKKKQVRGKQMREKQVRE